MTEIFSLDTESDRLSAVIEISVVSSITGVVLSVPINPGYPTADRHAAKGLPDSLLSTALPLDSYSPLLEQIFTGQNVIAWNMPFDQKFLRRELSYAQTLSCCMRRFDPYFHGWVAEYGNYHRTRLTAAMDALGLSYQSPGPHRAASDARACLDVWSWMEANPLNVLSENGLSPSKSGTVVRWSASLRGKASEGQGHTP